MLPNDRSNGATVACSHVGSSMLISIPTSINPATTQIPPTNKHATLHAFSESPLYKNDAHRLYVATLQSVSHGPPG